MSHDEAATGDGDSENRDEGVEFGDLEPELESHDYPATIDEIVDEYGDFELVTPGGSQSVESVLDPLVEEREGEEYESPEEVHQEILNMMGSEAVGREGYSDTRGAIEDEESGYEDESL